MANSFYELKDFAFATVMDVEVFPSEVFFYTDGKAYTLPGGDGTEVLPIAKLDSLTMSNITQEGPEKETRGGTASEPIIRFRKTVRLEMEDVVVTPPALRALFGAVVFDETGQRIDFSNYDPTTTKVTGFSITDTFAKMISLRGKTFVIERETGERRWIDITFNRFLPDSVLDMMMEAEGDLGVVNVAGELFPNDCGEYFVLGRIASPQCTDEDDAPLPTPTNPQ
jgi:hypothetical protein